MQGRIDRQSAQRRSSPGQGPSPVLAHVAQDGEFILAQTSDRGLRTNVGHLLGGAAPPLVAAVFSDL